MDMGERPRVDVAGVPVSVDHYVAGRRLSSPTTFEDRSPLDWSAVLAEVSAGDASAVDAALSAATEAFEGWAALGPSGRAPYLRRLADLVDERVADLAAVECVDMAMRHESLRNRVIGRGARNFRAYAELAEDHEERIWSSNGTTNRVQRLPAGPAVVITPWNAPFMLATWKLAPALAAGNPVVLKPAEWSPLSASLLADLVDEAELPPGVFDMIQGSGPDVGPALVTDQHGNWVSDRVPYEGLLGPREHLYRDVIHAFDVSSLLRPHLVWTGRFFAAPGNVRLRTALSKVCDAIHRFEGHRDPLLQGGRRTGVEPSRRS